MIVMIRDSKEHFYKTEENNETLYYSLKDRYELAHFDKKLNILYINSRYKDRFAKVIREIKKKYKNIQTSEYFNITTKDLGWEE